MTTSTAPPLVASDHAKLGVEASTLWDRYPPRPVPDFWPATCADRHSTLARLLEPPFHLDHPAAQHQRRFGLTRVLEWLEAQPGRTWQQRWAASGAATDGRAGWRRFPDEWLKSTGRIGPSDTTAYKTFGAALGLLICGDVIRPGLAWLITTRSPHTLASEMARTRDPDGFTELETLSGTSASNIVRTKAALGVARMMAAKGGTARDITVGDCLELVEVSATEWDDYGRAGKGPYFYQLLHAMGVFPPDAPATVCMFSSMYHGQLTPDQLIDRYALTCRPVRDLLVDYLRERQPGVDFATLTTLATNLGLLFWKDLEIHHPGIASLRLAPAMASA